MDRVGVLVNPIAGFGGTLALHGTDQLPTEAFDAAVSAGRSGLRMRRALARVLSRRVSTEFLVAPGLLGADLFKSANFTHATLDLGVPDSLSRQTTRDDTIAASRALVAAGVKCIIFAGGDGTATDLSQAVGTATTVIGVPSGVKMHSEAFARSPESAGDLLVEFLVGNTESVIAEVLDVADGGAPGPVGLLRVPRFRRLLQGAKASGVPQDDAISARAVAVELVAAASSHATWILGPGTTTAAIAEVLGFDATLRGVDVRHESGEIEHDVDEIRLHDIVVAAKDPHLVVGVVGGQGFLLGRGNHEISSRVIDRVGVERVTIVASERKIHALRPPILLVDVGDERAEHPLIGYRRVRTGARRSTVVRVVDAAEAS